jgi:hypothetical protein
MGKWANAPVSGRVGEGGMLECCFEWDLSFLVKIVGFWPWNRYTELANMQNAMMGETQ